MKFDNFSLGLKTRFCIIILILYPALLTYIILSNKIRLIIQIPVLFTTMIVSYLFAVLLQDYIYIKKHTHTMNYRSDLRFISPLFERSDNE